MKRLTLVLIMIIAFVKVDFAQNSSIDDDAISEYKNKDYESSRGLIDQSIKSVEGKEHAYTWHLRGHIYKHFFNLAIDEDLDDANREISISSFMRSMELDSEGTFKKANIDGLKPLTNSFWNEAVAVINKMDKATMHTAGRLSRKVFEN